MTASLQDLIDNISEHGQLSKSDCLIRAVDRTLCEPTKFDAAKYYSQLTGDHTIIPARPDFYFGRSFNRIFNLIKLLFDEFKFSDRPTFVLDAATLLTNHRAMMGLKQILSQVPEAMTEKLNMSSLDATASNRTVKGKPNLPTILADLGDFLSLCHFDVSMSYKGRLNKTQSDKINKVRKSFGYKVANYSRAHIPVMRVSNMKTNVFDNPQYWAIVAVAIEGIEEILVREGLTDIVNAFDSLNYSMFDIAKKNYEEQQIEQLRKIEREKLALEMVAALPDDEDDFTDLDDEW